MRGTTTQKAVIKDVNLTQRDMATRNMLKQLSDLAGVATVVQNTSGGNTAIRFNTSSNKLEYYDGSAWQEVG